MSWVDKVLKRVSNAIIPQYFNDTSDDWEPVKGSDGAINTKLIGSNMELYGATVASRPAANTVPVGAAFMAIDTQLIWQSDGVNWRSI